MEVVRYGKTCEVIQAGTNKSVEAEVYDFKEQKSLIVVINKSVKLNLSWNGRIYEGRMAGIDFVSDGPTISKNRIGR